MLRRLLLTITLFGLAENASSILRSTLKMRSVLLKALVTVTVLGSTVGLAYAGPITGVSVTTNGLFQFNGLGADFTGQGTGLYTLGNCSNNGVNSTCVFSGTYLEFTGTNPGAGGSFVLTTTYAGTSSTSPIVARSSIANPNSVGFIDPNLNGALMTLALSPSYGGLFVATLPPFGPTGLGFNAFLDGSTASCTGLSTSCSIGNVALNPGSVITGNILANGFNFSIPAQTPNTASVPEPGTMLLLVTGLGGIAVRLRRRL